MSLLDIHVLGSPILRETTEPVREVTDELRRLLDDMFETMYVAKGIGLAAPQVGRRERVAVVDVDGERFALVNPVVVERGTLLEKAEEGCLSIPEVYGDVERPATVRVHALDAEGSPLELDASALLARALQHEIDHLHGKLFLDYLGPWKRRQALTKWEKMKSDFPGLRRTLSPRDIATHHGGEEL
ncbi:MAG TPA: peptide deformylase [Gemmatimonadaceae bacterium]|nr:peptide deformylase [Gemmatimonadaceae bacterium]